MTTLPHDLFAEARARRRAASHQPNNAPSARSSVPSPTTQPLRSAESWIEVPSRESSASLSSAADEVITHGLRVGNSEPQRRRRPHHLNRTLHLSLDRERPVSAGGSSQDEYTESESESDCVMTSSNEAASIDNSSDTRSRSQSDAPTEEDEDDGDENITALGTQPRGGSCFTPQPNAFSHPPTSQATRLDHVAGSYFPSTRAPVASSATRRASSTTQHPRPTHSPYNAISPSRQPDHDAALRASLNTLLSCAAAARGLPKSYNASEAPEAKQPVSTTKARQKTNSTRINPNSLHIIQGSPKPTSNSSRPRQPSSSPSREPVASDKGKRKAPRSNSKERRSSKRLRSVGTDQVISPTLLTWVVSAGVLVLVSALSFSAGVSVGREAEKMNASGLTGSNALSDGSRRGSRSGLGLRRRLFNGAVRAVAA